MFLGYFQFNYMNSVRCIVSGFSVWKTIIEALGDIKFNDEKREEIMQALK